MKKISGKISGLTGGLASALVVAAIIASCGVIKPVPIETGTTVHVKDSTIIHIKDSIRVTEATRYKDMAWLGDSLKLIGNHSKAWAVADTAKEVLIGCLEEDKVEEKYKIIYKDKVEYKDSVVLKEIPIECTKEVVKTPRWAWWSLGFNLLVLVLLGLKIYLKFIKPI